MSASTMRVLRLRYGTKCAVCFRALEPGTRAEWNSVRKVAICMPCTKARPKGAVSRKSVAGGSARAEARRRREKQQAQLQEAREARPIREWLRQAIAPEPDAGASYGRGAVGEETLGASLDVVAEAGIIEVLHDRRRPRTTANIDHIAVAANGVWVIDAKRYTGRIGRGTRGGFFSSRGVLEIAGRDRSNLLDGVAKQIAAVAAALVEAPCAGVPVHGSLCFVDGEWGVFQRRPFSLDGVLITWPKALRERLSEPGDIDAKRRQQVLEALADALPPAS